jgi:hypothetical protein
LCTVFEIIPGIDEQFFSCKISNHMLPKAV